LVFINQNSQQGNYEELLKRLFNEAIQLFKEYPNEERVIIPLFKTLERLFERDEVLSQSEVLKEEIIQIFELINKEITGTKSVNKVRITHIMRILIHIIAEYWCFLSS